MYYWISEPDFDFLMIKDLTKEKIFNGLDFPFYLEPHRDEFYDKFMIHFKYERIGYKTLEEFKDHLQDIMLINAMKYKHYYDTQQKAKTLKWWNNKDYEYEQTRTLNSKSDTSSKSQSQSTDFNESDSNTNDLTNSISRFSDNPEGRVDDIDRYLTNATKDSADNSTQTHDETSTNSTGTSSTDNKNVGFEMESTRVVEGGNIGVTSSGDLIVSWLKDGLIDVDKVILNDLKVLFMQVY